MYVCTCACMYQYKYTRIYTYISNSTGRSPYIYIYLYILTYIAVPGGADIYIYLYIFIYTYIYSSTGRRLLLRASLPKEAKRADSLRLYSSRYTSNMIFQSRDAPRSGVSSTGGEGAGATWMCTHSSCSPSHPVYVRACICICVSVRKCVYVRRCTLPLCATHTIHALACMTRNGGARARHVPVHYHTYNEHAPAGDSCWLCIMGVV
jgi:hypothetical protein